MKKAETNVQFFSHLNGLVLDNKWGDMIRLLDTCLVYGLKLPDISTIEIQDEGKILIEFKSQHKCLLFQCITLSDFTPNVLNDKYRIVGVPTQTQILISSDLEKQSIDKIGTASLSSLDYEIVFSANTKRVYRAKNPTSQHPFLRVDESTASEDGSGIYNENYAKYAMVGLHENMTHIDDYLDKNKLQLPVNRDDLSANYKISGINNDCVRGWSKWYYAKAYGVTSPYPDTSSPANGARQFSLFGNNDAFYILRAQSDAGATKQLSGCGLFESDENKPWFLMTTLTQASANKTPSTTSTNGGLPLAHAKTTSSFICTQQSQIFANAHVLAEPILIDFYTGYSNIYSESNFAGIGIIFGDSQKKLRGKLHHILYAAKKEGFTVTTPLLSDSSMYIYDSAIVAGGATGGFYVYVGEL